MRSPQSPPKPTQPIILANKHPDAASVFEPEALLREARRQKGLAREAVPEVCILDPDGDMVRALRADGGSEPFAGWACYHTRMDVFALAGQRAGIVGCAVGAPFAVLVAEQLFASGCKLLLSVTSAGRIAEIAEPPYFVLIEKALRDEGTSYHYAAPAEYAEADPRLVRRAGDALRREGVRFVTGATWTTDAPFRETAEAIAAARDRNILAVEMEAAALYTFARVKGVDVVCLAHVTNTMGLSDKDFEKGEADGATDALNALAIIAAGFG